jgi:hypothetical protein
MMKQIVHSIQQRYPEEFSGKNIIKERSKHEKDMEKLVDA